MYDGFRYFAFEDATYKNTDIGMSNPMKFCSESLSTASGVIQQRVASDHTELIDARNGYGNAALQQIQTALCNGSVQACSRKRVVDLLDAESLAFLWL